jgi:methyltransferase (TIGR00027 family)
MDQPSPANHQITHVSDTALMVAACRALETEEPDAFARDPFAARLAGERGFAILNGLTWSMVLRFGMAVRTRFLDELLAEALADSVTAVLSVGCGLDTRPWRLNLPADLRWIEVDFPDVLDYKHGLLAGEKAHCRVERLSVDLNDPEQRQALYAAVSADRAIIITEGVLMYLPAATVHGLAAETGRHSGFAHWISDITTSAFSSAISGGGQSTSGFEHVRAPDALEGEQILGALNSNGWTTASMRSYIRDTAFTRDRARRVFGERPASAPPPFPPDDPTGIHHFKRA